MRQWILGGWIVLGLFSNLAWSRSFSDYHNLSENRTESAKYEIRKVIHGEVEAVMFSKSTRQILVKASHFLWKFDERGNLLDTYLGAGALYESGMLYVDSFTSVPFMGRRYVDWLYTGDKTEHAFPAIRDARSIRDAELFSLLDEAEQFEFFKEYSDGKDAMAVALLKLPSGWVGLDISNRAARVNGQRCDVRTLRNHEVWRSSCLVGYDRRPAGELVLLPNSLPFDRDWEDETQIAHIRKFNRKFYYFDEGLEGQLLYWLLYPKLKDYPGEPLTSYWFGDGYVELRHQNEQLRFKALVSNEEGKLTFDNIAVFDLPEGYNPDVKLIQLMYIGSQSNSLDVDKKLVPEHEADIGLYVVRPKDQSRRRALQQALQRGIVSGDYSTYFSRASWKPVYEGMGKSDDRYVDVKFFNEHETPQHYVFHESFADPGRHALPSGLRFNLKSGWRKYAFKLYVNEKEFVWVPMPKSDSRVVLEITFDEPEIVAAFRALDGKNKTLQLGINLEEIKDVGARLQINLRNASKSVILRRTVVVSRKLEYDGPERDQFQKNFEQSQLWIEFERAKAGRHALADFILATNNIVRVSGAINEHRVLLTQHTNNLLNHFTAAKDVVSAREVLTNYIDIVHPVIRQDANDDVVMNFQILASNGLALGTILRDAAFQDKVLASLLGENFALDHIGNATLMYNLACLYATRTQKDQMLAATERAVRMGKLPHKFLADEDFKAFWGDPDFRKALGVPGTTQ